MSIHNIYFHEKKIRKCQHFLLYDNGQFGSEEVKFHDQDHSYGM